MECEHSNHHY